MIDSTQPTKIKLPKINLKENDLAGQMSAAMADAGGVFEVSGLDDVRAPFEAIKELFKKMEEDPELAVRANAAYTNNLVFKDAYGAGKGGAKVDEKRVIDLSPSRLDTIVQVDAALANEFGQPLKDALEFFDQVRSEVGPKLISALSMVVGDTSLANDGMVNYRLGNFFLTVYLT